MKNFTLLFAILFLSFNSFAQEYSLSFNLNKGEIYKHVIGKREMTSNSFGERANTSDAMTVMSITYKVVDFVDGRYSLEMQFDSLSTTISAGSEELVFNSEDADQDNVGNKLLNNVKKVKHIVSFDKYGHDLKVVSDTAAQNKIFSDLRNSGDRSSRRYLMQLRGVLTSEQITEMIEPLFKLYSAEKVKVGDVWNEDWFSESMRMKMENKSLTEFTSIEGQFAVLNGEMKSTSVKEDPKDAEKVDETKKPTEEVKKAEEGQRTEGQGNMRSARSGRSGGNMRFRPNFDTEAYYYLQFKVDLKTGWVYSAAIEGESNGVGKIPPSEMNPDGMNISMSSKSVMQAFGTW